MKNIGEVIERTVTVITVIRGNRMHCHRNDRNVSP